MSERYRITAPDGQKYMVTVPDGTPQSQVMQYAMDQYRRQQQQPKPPAATPASPPAAPPVAARQPGSDTEFIKNGRLGYQPSSVVRPLAKGLGRAATFIPDIATWAQNKLIPENEFFGPALQAPGDWLQSVIDEYTTAPETSGGQTAEELAAMATGMFAGGGGGAKMPPLRLASTAKPAVKRLAEQGVTMTPGQRKGGTLNWLEENAGKIIPFIRNARSKAVEQWNVANLNDALKDARGDPVPAGLTGRDAISHAKNEMTRRYGEVYANAKVSPFSSATPFGQALIKVRQLFAGTQAGESSVLSQQQIAALKDIIDNKVVARFTSSGEASGKTITEIEEALRTEAAKHEGGDYGDRAIATALGDLHKAFEETIKKQNPAIAADLERLDQGYAKFKLSEKSSLASMTKEGNYTVGQRLNAIKNRDTSKDKGSTAAGKAPGQDVAEEAQRVLGNTQPDSGTTTGVMLLDALRLAGPAVVGGAGGSLAGDPAAGLLMGLGVQGGGAGLYSQPVLKLLQQSALRDSPELFRTLGAIGGGTPRPEDHDLSPTDLSKLMQEAGLPAGL